MGVAQAGGKLEGQLLSRDLDSAAPWLDPQEPITSKRVTSAARHLGIWKQEVRSCYEGLSQILHLKLAWRTEKRFSQLMRGCTLSEAADAAVAMAVP